MPRLTRRASQAKITPVAASFVGGGHGPKGSHTWHPCLPVSATAVRPLYAAAGSQAAHRECALGQEGRDPRKHRDRAASHRAAQAAPGGLVWKKGLPSAMIAPGNETAVEVSTVNLSERWSFEDLLAEGITLDQLLGELDRGLERFEGLRQELSPDLSGDRFARILDDYEALGALVRRLAAYAFLRFAADTQDPTVIAQQNSVNDAVAAAEKRSLFFELWFKALSDEDAVRLMTNSGSRRYFLESWRRLKPFTLSEAEERVITTKDVNGVDALVTIYQLITSGFKYTLDVDGERQTLTQDQVASYVRHPSPDVREAAYIEMYRPYTENSAVLAQIYHHRVRDWHAEMVEFRGFPSPISARNTTNDMPDDVVDTLLGVCRDNANVFQRYFRLKARLLNRDKLRRYDIYAPLATAEKRYELPQALDMVLETCADFSPVIADHARRVLEQGHLDALPRPGKRGGAFCYSALPHLTPWVLSNYTGRPRDVATLAHELGHAVHSMMASEHSLLTFEASLPLAETASVFNEMLLSQRLLAQETDPAVRRDMLANQVDGAYVTVIRQAYFTLFERDAHQMINQGATRDDLAAHYLTNLAEQFGDAVEISPEFQWEWLLIPHIYHTPFYTYAYSFGQLMVLALYQRYRAEGDSFKPRYMQLLAAGGSASPAVILGDAGIDAKSREFWQGGFDVVASLIAELEGLEGTF